MGALRDLQISYSRPPKSPKVRKSASGAVIGPDPGSRQRCSPHTHLKRYLVVYSRTSSLFFFVPQKNFVLRPLPPEVTPSSRGCPSAGSPLTFIERAIGEPGGAARARPGRARSRDRTTPPWRTRAERESNYPAPRRPTTPPRAAGSCRLRRQSPAHGSAGMLA